MTHLKIQPAASELVHYTDPHLPVFLKREELSGDAAQDIHPHCHQEVELIHVLRGSMFYKIDGDVFRLNEGDCLYVNSGHLHESFLINESCCQFHIALIHPSLLTFEPYILSRYRDAILDNVDFSGFALQPHQRGADELGMLIDRLVKSEEEKTIGYDLDIVADCHRILKNVYLKYYHVYQGLLKSDDKERMTLNRMILYIYENYQENLTLEMIAQSGNISVSTCCRLFKRYLEITPTHYLNRYRLTVSCELLKRTEMSMAEIAQSCGFNQQSYYNHLFKSLYHTTPLQFRKEEHESYH